ncbi:polysaccharide deacetylase [Burkholderia ubonensis]|uniref:polysaccharide deacetylase family protein n=1 Tax=Burkholderia ubonensis TaxID=101571 RepID=UPI0007527BEA|nr:polysaccharide deacetylase family protein [Burkholderia ubonensis]KWI91855.1 polysaccharide deacetylase [Burkholderia ubonensis]KWK01938.1 polysaccharide deacetylase [Burkholderia ubonensis]KWK12363.1 polysaccharide deacetylase [Burkholderia ubonensis]KWK41315.1 polysaccharide deacetylase [Burkholderia ubonensis]KWK43501.1 polysaccharide deacetylase [Burkholderia ubonensis]
MRKCLAVFSLLAMAGLAQAAGPSAVASVDRSLWPDPAASPAGFDRASRAEMLSFAHALSESERDGDGTLRDRLKLKQFDKDAIDRVRKIYWRRLTANYTLASVHCVRDEPFCPGALDEAAFRKAAAAFTRAPDDRYAAWFAASQRFHRTYLDELLRLASLFPRISSEVATYSSSELSGGELADRHFLLTFDDGPTPTGGNTDKLLNTLRKQHLNATFFVLGEPLQTRLQQDAPGELSRTYQGMCVGSHGWQHKSHSAWPQWQDSVTRSIGLVKNSLPSSYVPLFRPPYGQRRADSGAFFDARGLHVALWNIDSQDWNSKVDADQVKQRVLTLMLLWRRGVILFHDIHEKAQTVVPWLVEQTNGTDLQWVDCHTYGLDS